MEVLKIIFLCVAAAVGYGIVHDQVTARVCIEYFTIGHPPLFHTDSLTLLALGWGVLATWWVGLPLGLLMAIAARAGRRLPRSAKSLVRPILILLLVMTACALIAGIVGYVLAERGSFVLWEPLASQVPSEKHARFLADASAHSASYLVGAVGGIIVTIMIWRSRSRRSEHSM
jgi:hypothetical protein